ncbi:MAG TPA: methylated-DNA--[protein]-cysteine S-methyltransferase [Acidisoma sp.]|nr:methylated-DNA--[protein]-cysteine S-methyltransferase [Acidisoma sp.]
MPQLSLHTPIGPITVSAEDNVIVAVDWGWGRDQEATPILIRARTWLQDYFDARIAPMDLTLDPHGTAYRRRVWATVAGIAPGEAWSYRQVAEIAGGSPRSIGMAMASNPIPILIPCHRVLGSGPNGRLTIGGYSGGEGIETKRFLLNLETRATSQRPFHLSPSEEMAAQAATAQQRITR